jgi:regulation of enolase protein 1 (concanavalin A-like superfamily)
VKLVRAGTTITAYRSADGLSWTPFGSATVTLSTTVYVGLAVSSRNNIVAAAAAFDNVATGNTDPPPNAPPSVSVLSPSASDPFTAPATITLKATAGDTDGTVIRVDYFISTSPTPIGSSTGAPLYTAIWNSVAAGTYSLTARATDNGGATTTSVPVSVTVTPASGGGLPSPWFAQDVGAVGVAGTTTGNGTSFSISGSGADIWNSADAFQFVYRPLAGDGQISARVASLQNTDNWAKAGVMIRDALTPDARYAALLVTPGNGLAFQQRLVTGGTSSYTSGSGVAPTWVKLVRVGTTINAYRSADGLSWTAFGSATVTLSATVYVGLAVSSHSNSVAASVAFDNITVP